MSDHDTFMQLPSLVRLTLSHLMEGDIGDVKGSDHITMSGDDLIILYEHIIAQQEALNVYRDQLINDLSA